MQAKRTKENPRGWRKKKEKEKEEKKVVATRREEVALAGIRDDFILATETLDREMLLSGDRGEKSKKSFFPPR